MNDAEREAQIRREAYTQARKDLREEGYCMACGVYHRVGQCEVLEHAKREVRAAAISEALAILHDEGWLGRSEQRIADLADSPPQPEAP